MTKTAQRKPKSRRNSLLAQIHIGIKSGRIDEARYRDLLEERFGVRSAKALNATQLEEVAAAVRRTGAVDSNGRGASAGWDRPTSKQWDKLACLARQMWDEGLEAKGLAKFVRHVAKVDSPRFLGRAQMTAVLLGLERWIEFKAKRASQPEGGES